MGEGSAGLSGPDPGWGPAVRRYLTWGLGRQRDDGLTIFRVLHLSLTAATILILLVLTFIHEEIGAPSGPEALLVGGLASASLAGAAAARSRPLDGDTGAALAASYRTHYFLGFALSEAPLLLAFVLTFIWDELWPYVAVLPAFLVAMALIAPGRGNLERIQSTLIARGSSLSLTEALRVEPPRPPR